MKQTFTLILDYVNRLSNNRAQQTHLPLDEIFRDTYPPLNRGQTQEHAQCTRTRSPAAKISRANFIETIAEPLLREKKIEWQWLIC